MTFGECVATEYLEKARHVFFGDMIPDIYNIRGGAKCSSDECLNVLSSRVGPPFFFLMLSQHDAPLAKNECYTQTGSPGHQKVEIHKRVVFP